MGVYIKGMEMPKCCASCDVACLHYLNRGLDGLLAKICRIESRLPNCPLVPVPPHGDLIDKETVRKNLVEELQRNKDPFPYQSYYPSWNDAVMAMLSAPTIITASGEEDGET